MQQGHTLLLCQHMQTAATTRTGSKQDSKNNQDNKQRNLNQSCGPLQHTQPYRHSKRSLLVSHLICCKVSHKVSRCAWKSHLQIFTHT
jgi:hypothetical protein